MKVRYSKKVPLIAVDGVPVIGSRYHVAWGYSRGVVGVCVSVDEGNKTVQLRTPKTKQLFRFPTKWSDLRHTRKEQYKIENKIIKPT